MKQLVLKCGAVVLIDEDDFERISAHQWHLSHNGYAIRRIREESGKKRIVYLHREVFDAPKNADIDHADGNRLNNTKENLRVASRTLNNANSKPRVGCSSRFKGVAWVKNCQRWWAYIGKDGKRTSLGYFKDEIQAAIAYNKAALVFFGEFARLNPI